MSRAEFLQVFNRLSVALREPPDATGITQSTYFDALNDLTLEALKAGATALMREPGRKFFPTTAEWRTASKELEREAIRLALPPGRTEPWHYQCLACLDTGWIVDLECDGGAEQWPEAIPKRARGNQLFKGNREPKGYRALERETNRPRAVLCGREKPHAPHVFTRACGCRATNPTYRRHQEAHR